jgi:hypothetical protein
MGYIQGEGWTQGILFPVVLDELVPADHVRRVIDAFATKLAMTDLDSLPLFPSGRRSRTWSFVGGQA